MDYRNLPIYAVTISPPKRECTKESYIFETDKSYIKRYLNKISSHYCLYPEYDLQGRLHYHGIITIKDWIKYHKQIHRLIQKNIGFIKLDKLLSFKDHLRYLIYAQKGFATARQIIDIKDPIIYSKIKRDKTFPQPSRQGLLNYISLNVEHSGDEMGCSGSPSEVVF